MRNLQQLLAEHDFFRGLPPDVFEEIAGCGVNAHFAEREYLFHEGEAADRFFVLRQGRVAFEIFAPGRGPIVIDVVGAGDVVGWSWLFPPYRWTFDAQAVEETSAVVLDGVCLRDKCDANPAMGYELMKRFAEIMRARLQATRMQLIDVYAANRG